MFCNTVVKIIHLYLYILIIHIRNFLNFKLSKQVPVSTKGNWSLLRQYQLLIKLVTHNVTSSNYSNHIIMSHVHMSIYSHFLFFVYIWFVPFDAAGLVVSWSPWVKGQEVNELWLRALVSNESRQWLNRVIDAATKLTWLWMRREACLLAKTLQHRTHRHFCLRFTNNTSTGVFVLEIYASAI